MASGVAAHAVINRSVWAYDQPFSQFRHGGTHGNVTRRTLLLLNGSGAVEAVTSDAADQRRMNIAYRRSSHFSPSGN